MIYLNDGLVLLRDLQQSDIEKRIYWETLETEWKLWDGPWHYENLSEEQQYEELNRCIEKIQAQIFSLQNTPNTQKRTGFQICTIKGICIGWCNSYHIDDNYHISPSGKKCAIGINIPDVNERGKGYALHALCIFIDYLLEHNEYDLFIQTWSGNIRMITIANKLGFEEVQRKLHIHRVRGNLYDGLTFHLNISRYAMARQALTQCGPKTAPVSD